MRKRHFLAIIAVSSSFITIGCGGDSKKDAADGSVVGDASQSSADGSTPDGSSSTTDGGVATDGSVTTDDGGGTPADMGADAVVETNPLSPFVGFWTISEFVQGDTTFLPDSTPRVAGDVVIAASDTDGIGSFDVRIAMLNGNSLLYPPSDSLHTIELASDGTVLVYDPDSSTEFSSFTPTFDDADHLLFTRNDDYAGNTNDSGTPSIIRFQRGTPLPTTLVGAWDMVSFMQGGNTITMGECMVLGVATRGIFDITYDISPRLMGVEHVVRTTYPIADTTCSGKPSDVNEVNLYTITFPGDANMPTYGYLDDGDGFSSGDAIYIGLTAASDGDDGLNVTVAECEPSGCETQLPSSFHLVPSTD